MRPLLLSFAGLLGLALGSFGTVVAYRLPLGLGLGGRSVCPHCGRTISWRENIPLLSYLLLKGRCRGCGASISLRYPLAEFATALLLVASVWRYGLSMRALLAAGLSWVLIVLSAIDLEHHILPNRVVYPAVIGSWAVIVTGALLGRGDVVPAALGAGVFGGLLLLLALISPRGMGGGDVKLGFLLGSVLGYLEGLPAVLVAMFLAFLSGGIGGLIVVLSRHGSRKSQIPFGPFLGLGSLLAIFFGESLARFYLESL